MPNLKETILFWMTAFMTVIVNFDLCCLSMITNLQSDSVIYVGVHLMLKWDFYIVMMVFLDNIKLHRCSI